MVVLRVTVLSQISLEIVKSPTALDKVTSGVRISVFRGVVGYDDDSKSINVTIPRFLAADSQLVKAAMDFGMLVMGETKPELGSLALKKLGVAMA